MPFEKKPMSRPKTRKIYPVINFLLVLLYVLLIVSSSWSKAAPIQEYKDAEDGKVATDAEADIFNTEDTEWSSVPSFDDEEEVDIMNRLDEAHRNSVGDVVFFDEDEDEDQDDNDVNDFDARADENTEDSMVIDSGNLDINSTLPSTKEDSNDAQNAKHEASTQNIYSEKNNKNEAVVTVNGDESKQDSSKTQSAQPADAPEMNDTEKKNSESLDKPDAVSELNHKNDAVITDNGDESKDDSSKTQGAQPADAPEMNDIENKNSESFDKPDTVSELNHKNEAVVKDNGDELIVVEKENSDSNAGAAIGNENVNATLSAPLTPMPEITEEKIHINEATHDYGPQPTDSADSFGQHNNEKNEEEKSSPGHPEHSEDDSNNWAENEFEVINHESSAHENSDEAKNQHSDDQGFTKAEDARAESDSQGHEDKNEEEADHGHKTKEKDDYAIEYVPQMPVEEKCFNLARAMDVVDKKNNFADVKAAYLENECIIGNIFKHQDIIFSKGSEFFTRVVFNSEEFESRSVEIAQGLSEISISCENEHIMIDSFSMLDNLPKLTCAGFDIQISPVPHMTFAEDSNSSQIFGGKLLIKSSVGTELLNDDMYIIQTGEVLRTRVNIGNRILSDFTPHYLTFAHITELSAVYVVPLQHGLESSTIGLFGNVKKLFKIAAAN